MGNLDEKLKQLEEILENCILNDISITSREVVAQSNGTFKNPSDITRNKFRRPIFESFKERQNRIRENVGVRLRRSRKALLVQNAVLEQAQREKFEAQQLIIASHRAAILAVGEVGGIKAWLKFFENYNEALAQLERLGVLPDSVIPFPVKDVEQ